MIAPVVIGAILSILVSLPLLPQTIALRKNKTGYGQNFLFYSRYKLFNFFFFVSIIITLEIFKIFVLLLMHLF
jgi:hypothetical protein